MRARRHQLSLTVGGLSALAALSACETRDPPGRVVGEAASITLRAPAPASAGASSAAPASSGPLAVPSELAAALDTEPGQGAKLASIAMRTWIYDAPRDRSSKLGYLRAGALIDRGEVSVGTDGCDGGWYRVAPRGYACVGKGATLALDHPIVLAATRGPRRGEPLPYTYVMSDNPAPHLYFKLPTPEDQRRVEGPTYRTHVGLERARFKDLVLDPVPAFLAEGHRLPTPYGSEKNLSYSVHRGRAKDNSAFGLTSLFDWTDRRFGLTTELDLIPIDRTKPAKISQLHGIELEEGGRPAFVVLSGTAKYELKNDQPVESGSLPGRTAVELTGENRGGERGLLETADGLWLPASGLIIPEIKKDRANFAERGRKWISVSIDKQVLVAYEGERPVYAALVSTGRGGMSDPAKTTATIRGTFMIRSKHVSGTMDGDETSEDSFDLRDVPYIQYFHEGYALHAAYWHDDFGRPRSHGCVNLAPADAAWLFEWTDPPVPEAWHGAVSPQGGTLVYVHR